MNEKEFEELKQSLVQYFKDRNVDVVFAVITPNDLFFTSTACPICLLDVLKTWAEENTNHANYHAEEKIH